MGDSAEGKAYYRHFTEAFNEPLMAALNEHGTRPFETFRINLVFVVSVGGTVERVIQAPDQPKSAYFAEKFTGLKLPAPPQAGWLINVEIKLD